LGFEILPFKFYSKFRVLAGKTKYLAPKMQLGQPIATISWQWVCLGGVGMAFMGAISGAPSHNPCCQGNLKRVHQG
jgi:hypothetical protein